MVQVSASAFAGLMGHLEGIDGRLAVAIAPAKMQPTRDQALDLRKRHPIHSSEDTGGKPAAFRAMPTRRGRDISRLMASATCRSRSAVSGVPVRIVLRFEGSPCEKYPAGAPFISTMAYETQ
jgi:hypothetical protein